MNEILNNKILYPSAGCLLGSLYCFPVYKQGTKFVLHNLGNYIFNTELPQSILAKNKNSDINMILIEVKNIDLHNNPITGIDYLGIGDFHKKTFDDLSFLLTPDEKDKLENKALSAISATISVFELLVKYENQEISAEELIDRMSIYIPKTLILGYILFESISVYITHNSFDKDSLDCFEDNEIPNRAYKQFCFSLKDNLFSNFSLSTFNPSVPEITKIYSKLSENKIILFEYQSFLEGIADIFTRMAYMYLSPSKGNFSQNDFLKESKENIFKKYSNIFGHAIHRELRTFRRYDDFYFYFDQVKALEMWNIWNRAGVVVPYNSIIKKGEIGINPASPDIDITLYSTLLTVIDGKTTAKIKEKIEVDLKPRLNDFKNNSMRNI